MANKRRTEPAVVLEDVDSDKDPIQIYKECCSVIRKNPFALVTAGIQEFEFGTKLDYLSENEIKVFKSLWTRYHFAKVRLYGDVIDDHPAEVKAASRSGSNTRTNPRNSATKQPEKSKSRSLSPSDEANNRNIPATVKTTKFFKALTTHLPKNNKLEVLQLTGIPFTKEGLEALSKGLKATASLKELYINYCGFTTQDLEILNKGLVESRTLNLIDLSNNYLGDECARLICSLIANHSKRRDETIWLYGLRGEYPDEDIELSGICDINLSYNFLGDNFAEIVASTLNSDGWLKNLNLRGNRIGDHGLKQFHGMMKLNTSLFALDLRENPFFESQLNKDILNKLAENITNYKIKNNMLNLETPNSAIPEETNEGDTMTENQSVNNHSEHERSSHHHHQVHQHRPYSAEPNLSKINRQEIDELIKKYESITPVNEEENGEENSDYEDRLRRQTEPSEESKEIQQHNSQSYSKNKKKTNSSYSEAKYQNEADTKIQELTNYCQDLESRLGTAENKISQLQIDNKRLQKTVNLLISDAVGRFKSPKEPSEAESVDRGIDLDSNLTKDTFGYKKVTNAKTLERIEELMAELTELMDGIESEPVPHGTAHFTTEVDSRVEKNSIHYTPERYLKQRKDIYSRSAGGSNKKNQSKLMYSTDLPESSTKGDSYSKHSASEIKEYKKSRK